MRDAEWGREAAIDFTTSRHAGNIPRDEPPYDAQEPFSRSPLLPTFGLAATHTSPASAPEPTDDGYRRALGCSETREAGMAAAAEEEASQSLSVSLSPISGARGGRTALLASPALASDQVPRNLIIRILILIRNPKLTCLRRPPSLLARCLVCQTFCWLIAVQGSQLVSLHPTP